ncbi:MAG: DUF167 domain-containing protein [Nitrospinota bacterium]|nr:DUF167 domain-containing protein [Nitrospinota bacterium]
MPLKIKKVEGGIQFSAAIQPRSSKNQVVGVHNSALKVRLTSPPVEWAANRSCIKVLGKFLGISPSRIGIAVGLTSKNKTIHIEGMTEESLLKKLRPPVLGPDTPGK